MQSNISAHVARLERELGAPLIDRADGRLTEEGTVVVARARRILSELDALVSDVAACKDEVTGTVRVGMIGTTARWLVPRLMDMARKRHPKLRLVVVEGNTTGLEPQLASGQLDLAVLHLPLTGRDLVARLLFEEDLMLVVPQGHAMAIADRPLDLEDLADMELLLPVPGTAFRDELDAVTRPLGITLLPGGRDRRPPAHRLADLRGVRPGHPAGHRHPLLPAFPVPPVRIEGLPRRRVGVAQRSRGLPSAPTRALNELLKAVVAMPEDRPRACTSTNEPARRRIGPGPRPITARGDRLVSGTRGSRHIRHMGGPPVSEWSSSTTSNPNRA